MAFRWRSDDGPLSIVVIGSSLPLSTKKDVFKVETPLTTLSGSAHVALTPIKNPWLKMIVKIFGPIVHNIYWGGVKGYHKSQLINQIITDLKSC